MGHLSKLQFERPNNLQISRALHQSRHLDCGLAPEHVDVRLAEAIVADRDYDTLESEVNSG